MNRAKGLTMLSTDERAAITTPSGKPAAARRRAMGLIGLTLMMPLIACGQGGKNMQREAVLALIMYSYVDRPIHDIIFDGTDIGVANSYGGTGDNSRENTLRSANFDLDLGRAGGDGAQWRE